MSSSGVCAVSRSTSRPSALRRAQVPALAVGLRALGDLHQERDLLRAQPGEDARVERRAEVVGVGDERVLEAALEQLARASRR